MARHCRTPPVPYLSDCFMEEAYEEGFDVIFNHGSGWRRQGMCWDTLICLLKNVFEPHIPLGGSKT